MNCFLKNSLQRYFNISCHENEICNLQIWAPWKFVSESLGMQLIFTKTEITSDYFYLPATTAWALNPAWTAQSKSQPSWPKSWKMGVEEPSETKIIPESTKTPQNLIICENCLSLPWPDVIIRLVYLVKKNQIVDWSICLGSFANKIKE